MSIAANIRRPSTNRKMLSSQFDFTPFLKHHHHHHHRHQNLLEPIGGIDGVIDPRFGVEKRLALSHLTRRRSSQPLPHPHTSPVFTAPPPPLLVAAAGKVGAIVGAYGFVYASHSTDSKKNRRWRQNQEVPQYSRRHQFLGDGAYVFIAGNKWQIAGRISGENEKDSEPTPTANRRSRSGPVRLID
ncbi:hypothetical protein Ccrd_001603 [Cynara cardunculus var. scolymus]|uniref:Uncharacterized protein n=1 Tax=Cynara cardunculus var. scolymus TaxID=59895 RepID=A0A103XSY9_CYNCS|nr:hypothetical protein Ccrd_001603 [Cynara cardunculus var. scolymus]